MDHDNIRQLIEEKNIKWIQTHFKSNPYTL